MVVTKIRLYRESGSNLLIQEVIYGQNGLSQNNACTNEIRVVVDGFELASGELLRIAYEKQESARSVKEVLNYTLMSANPDGTYSQEVPYEVTNGKPCATWDISLQIVSGAVEKKDDLTDETTTSYKYKECTSNRVGLTVNNVIKDKDNNYPTLHDFTTYAIPKSEKGAINGVAPLGSDGRIDKSYLPADIGEGGGSGSGGVSRDEVQEVVEEVVAVEVTPTVNSALEVAETASNAATQANEEAKAAKTAANEAQTVAAAAEGNAKKYTDGEIAKVNAVLESYSKTAQMEEYVNEKIEEITYPDIVTILSDGEKLDDIKNPVKNMLYLVLKTDGGGDDLYDEYLYNEKKEEFEYLGTRKATVDLTNYATKDDLNDYVTDEELERKGYQTEDGVKSIVEDILNGDGTQDSEYATKGFVKQEVAKVNTGGGGEGGGFTQEQIENFAKEAAIVQAEETADVTARDVVAELNIENGNKPGAIQQDADGVAGGFSFSGKNANAADLDTQVDLWNRGNGNVQYGATGNFSSSFGGKSAAIGKRSHAEGTTTIAKGNYSHVEGDNSVTLGADSHAEGYATVTGPDAQAGHAEGINTQALGLAAHAEGQDTIAYGQDSHAEGSNTATVLKNAEGDVVAFGEAAHAEGGYTKAVGNYSHSEGYTSEASAEAAHAEGKNTIANNIGAHAEGNSTRASGPNAHAEGNDTNATGYHAHAEGKSTTAKGSHSHAEGDTTTAEGASSHAGGTGAHAKGNYSFAHGNTVVAGYANQFVVGQFNKNDELNIFEVGNGSDTKTLSNNFEVRKDTPEAYVGGKRVLTEDDYEEWKFVLQDGTTTTTITKLVCARTK